MRGTSDAKTGDMTRQERLDRAEEITLWEAEDLTHRAVKVPERERAKPARRLILLARSYGCDLGLMLGGFQAAKGLPSATPFPSRVRSFDTERAGLGRV